MTGILKIRGKTYIQQRFRTQPLIPPSPIMRSSMKCISIGLLLLYLISTFLVQNFIGSALYDELFVRVGKFVARFLPERVERYDDSDTYNYHDLDSWATHPDKQDW